MAPSENDGDDGSSRKTGGSGATTEEEDEDVVMSDATKDNNGEKKKDEKGSDDSDVDKTNDIKQALYNMTNVNGKTNDLFSQSPMDGKFQDTQSGK